LQLQKDQEVVKTNEQAKINEEMQAFVNKQVEYMRGRLEDL
jgi:hypothetical protein